jgi:hypothetical protein
MLLFKVQMMRAELNEKLKEMDDKGYRPARNKDIAGLYKAKDTHSKAVQNVLSEGGIITGEIVDIDADYVNGWMFWVQHPEKEGAVIGKEGVQIGGMDDKFRKTREPGRDRR